MFHETRFPTDISRGATGGPERRTDVVTLGSGHEQRNARWANSRRAWNAGYGVKSLDDLYAVIAFFEERRGRLYGFRWRDHADWKSGPPQATPTALDQPLGLGTGTQSAFQLAKTYGSAHAPWLRAGQSRPGGGRGGRSKRGEARDVLPGGRRVLDSYPNIRSRTSGKGAAGGLHHAVTRRPGSRGWGLISLIRPRP